ncbi:MAG: hypothetical protein GY778_28490 [bacterium]|nr:hypothetical protein [bacterium]
MLLAASGLLVVVLPVIAGAAWPDSRRSLADKLRYGPGVTNHPVHVVPSAAIDVPADWPLEAEGTIGCLTCHTQLPPFGSVEQPFLRGSADGLPGRAFCATCHTSDSTRSAQSQHWTAMSSAHTRNRTETNRGHSGMLDAESRQCMACHDGVGASDAKNSTPWNRGPGHLGDRKRNHPVGVDYPSHGNRKSSTPLRPATMLPEEVRLPGGQVSCVSCHDLYARDPARLTVPIERSALCFTCHEMD